MSNINDSFKKARSICKLAKSASIELLKEGNVTDILSDIPFLHLLYDLPNSVITFREKIYVSKCAKYIYELEEVSDEERNEFYEELESRNKQDSATTILGLIDRYDNINKVEILVNLLKANVKQEISIEDFLRLSSLLERIPYVDIENLEKFKTNNYISGTTDILLSAGCIRLTVIDGGDASGRSEDKYRLTELGIMLCRHGLNIGLDDDNEQGIAISSNTWVEL